MCSHYSSTLSGDEKSFSTSFSGRKAPISVTDFKCGFQSSICVPLRGSHSRSSSSSSSSSINSNSSSSGTSNSSSATVHGVDPNFGVLPSNSFGEIMESFHDINSASDGRGFNSNNNSNNNNKYNKTKKSNNSRNYNPMSSSTGGNSSGNSMHMNSSSKNINNNISGTTTGNSNHNNNNTSSNNNNNNVSSSSSSSSSSGSNNNDSGNNSRLSSESFSNRRNSNSAPEERQCWVCLATEDDDREAEWAQPCKCKGATKWVHQRCIQRWIDEKQAGSCSVTVACPQCNSDYVVIYPRLKRFVFVLDAVDRLVFRVSPFVAAGVVMGSIYWSAVTFGAVTVLQVLGYKDGLKYMEASDPFFLLVGLPTIPMGLLLAKMVPWEECCLRLWLQRSTGLKQFLSRVTGLPAGASVPRVSPSESLMNSPGFGDAMNATRLICSALLLPTISTLLGKLLFPNIRSGVQRAFLAAMVFSIVKGLLKIYLRKEQYIRQAKRKVMDYQSSTQHNTTPSELADSGVHQV